MAEGALATAFVAIRPEISGFKSALNTQLRGAIRETSTQGGALAKQTNLGTSALDKFKSAAVFASGALIGGYGLAYGLKEVTKAATDHVALETQLRNAVERSGLSYQQYASQIQSVIKGQEDLGFAEDVSTRSFTLALRATGSVSGAQRLLATSANVARGANKDLYSSTLVLVRAYDGATTGLKRLGIEVQKGSKGYDVLNQVQRKYAGAAVAYANSAAGAQARLTVAIHQTEIAIGTALLPTVTRLATHLSDWLDKSKNQERIQRDVNTAVKDGTAIVSAFSSVVKSIAGPIEDASSALGGLKNTAEDLFAVFAAYKFAKFIKGFQAIGAAAGPAGAAGEVTALEGGLTGLAAISIPEIVIPIAIAYSISNQPQVKSLQNKVKGALGPFGFLADSGPQFLNEITKPLQNAINAIRTGSGGPATLAFADVLAALRAGSLTVAGVQALKSRFKSTNDYNAALAYARQYALAAGKDQAAAASLAAHAKPDVAGGTSKSIPFGTGLISPLDRARSAANANPNSVQALTDLQVLLDKNIATEDARLKSASGKKQAAKFLADYNSLVSERLGVAGQIQSIQDQAAAKQQAAADKAKVAADKAAAAAKKAADARQRAYLNTVQITETNLRTEQKASDYSASSDQRLLAFYRKEEHDQQLSGVARADFRAKAIDEITRETGARATFNSKLDAALTRQGTLAKTQATAVAKAKTAAIQIREGALTLARQAADVAVARAGTNQTLLDKATTLEKKADEALIKYYRGRVAATKGLARQGYLQQLYAAQIDLAGLSKKAAQAGSFTLSQLYAEAESEYKMYGSNYGPNGTALSPQADRAALSGRVISNSHRSVSVTQHFYGGTTRPSDAIIQARNAARILN